jgi:hypothetical protein
MMDSPNFLPADVKNFTYLKNFLQIPKIPQGEYSIPSGKGRIPSNEAGIGNEGVSGRYPA